jgi:hypothetical protein
MWKRADESPFWISSSARLARLVFRQRDLKSRERGERLLCRNVTADLPAATFDPSRQRLPRPSAPMM